MSDVRTESGAPTRAPAAPPQPEPPRRGARGRGAGEIARALPHAARGQHRRRHGHRGDLLRRAERPLLHAGELREPAAVLRPVRDPGRGRGAADGGGRDRPVDRLGLPVRAVHVLRVQPGRGRARPVPDPRAAVLRGRRDHQRRLHRDHRRVVVHHDARHAARARRPDADHLPRPAGRDAGRRGDVEDRERHPRRQRPDGHAAREGQRDRDVREDLRRRDLLRADLGAASSSSPCRCC